jgi:hypothetical protein
MSEMSMPENRSKDPRGCPSWSLAISSSACRSVARRQLSVRGSTSCGFAMM